MNTRLNVHHGWPCGAAPMRARVAGVCVPRASGTKDGASASGYSVAGMYVVPSFWLPLVTSADTRFFPPTTGVPRRPRLGA